MSATYGPRNVIVTNGLLLYLDAANTNSYPGTGNTWFDLSGNNNHGTFINSPSFSSNSGGGIVFNGINTYIQFATVSVQTICVWGKFDTGIPSLAGLVCTSATGDGALRTESNSFRATNADINDFQSGSISSFMINGVSNLPTVNGYIGIPGGRTLYQNYYVGAIGNARNISTLSHTFNNRVYKGTIYAVCLYNRKLTDIELNRNYQVHRTRLGL